LIPRLVSGSSAKRPEPSGINAMLRVQQNSTGQPWDEPGHDEWVRLLHQLNQSEYDQFLTVEAR